MNKMQMAHDWYMKHSESSSFMYIEVDQAWKYADAMQAEAEKREDKTRPEVLGTEDSPQLDIHGLLHGIDEYFDQAECTKTHRMANNLLAEIYEKLSGEVNSVREWQPDWSQAPAGCLYWILLEGGDYIWMDGIYNRISEAPSFNYQGNWKESLRKRPQ